jgi:hypothetical protein
VRDEDFTISHVQSSSRLLSRGVLGNVARNTLEGRFLTNLEETLLAGMPDPTPVQRLLITDYCRRAWEMEQLFPLVAAGNADVMKQKRYDALRHEQHVVQQQLFGKPTAPRNPRPKPPAERPVLADVLAGMPS